MGRFRERLREDISVPPFAPSFEDSLGFWHSLFGYGVGIFSFPLVFGAQLVSWMFGFTANHPVVDTMFVAAVGCLFTYIADGVVQSLRRWLKPPEV